MCEKFKFMENEEEVEEEQLCSSGFSTMPPPLKIAAETMVRHKTDMIKIIKICQSGTNTCLKELLPKHKEKCKYKDKNSESLVKLSE